jgi:hypothetical protein
VGLDEGSTVAQNPTRLKSREVSIERTSHPNRFPSQWLISAYEKIIPSSPRRGPSLAPTADPIDEVNPSVNNMKETS